MMVFIRASLLVTVLLLFLSFVFFSQQTPKTAQKYTTYDVLPGSQKVAPQPYWLICTISPAQNPQRRAIIRSTWQSLFRNSSIYTTRFILSNPGPFWDSVIAHENATHGDLIILESLRETREIANTIKPIELFQRLRRDGLWGQRFAWVSKVDDDSFVDPRLFNKRWLVPRMDNVSLGTESSLSSIGSFFGKETQLRANVNRTIIPRRYMYEEYMYPDGPFYTMTWDMMELVAKLYEKTPESDRKHTHEDILIGHILTKTDIARTRRMSARRRLSPVRQKIGPWWRCRATKRTISIWIWCSTGDGMVRGLCVSLIR